MVAAIFIVINYLLTLLARYLERRLQASRRGPKAPLVDPMLNPAMTPAAPAPPRRPRPPDRGAVGPQRAVSVARDSRTTTTLIWPG